MSSFSSLNIAPNRNYSVQMQAVVLILKADTHLVNSVSGFINFDTETIRWDEICKIPFSSGHRAAITWAYAIWTDELRPSANCLEAALAMTPDLQAAVLRALALRWGLVRD